MENLYTVHSLCEKTSSIGDKEVVDTDCELLVEESNTKRQKKGKSKQDKGDEDDKHWNWLDTEVESLIALKGEPDFVKNAKKQGVDMWLKLHSRLMCLHPEFRKTPKACKSKFSDIYKAYKNDKQANNISGDSCHTCKFYDYMDVWYHQNGSILKHISASSSDVPSTKGDEEEVKLDSTDATPSSTSKDKKATRKMKYQESALELMGQMVVNSKDMAQSMKEANGFMNSLEKHIEKLIEKL